MTNDETRPKPGPEANAYSTELRVWILTYNGREGAYISEVGAQRAYDREHRRGNIVKRETALLVEHDSTTNMTPNAWLVTSGHCNCKGTDRHVYLDADAARSAVATYEAKRAGAAYSVVPAITKPYLVTDRRALAVEVMTWTKVSDDFPDDCWQLSDAAFRLHLEGLCWSNRKLLDLRIPKDDLRRFAKTADALPELLEHGYWKEADDAYLIHHHGRYQRKRSAVIAQQKANQRNGAKGGRPPSRTSEDSSPPRERWGESDSVSETESERDGTGQEGQGYRSEHEEPEEEANLWDSPKGVTSYWGGAKSEATG